MKFKRILSSALTAVLVLTTVITAVPIQSSAMHSASVDTSAQYTADEIKETILVDMLSYNFDSADEMLAYELEAGYLDYIHSADRKFSLYANRYTGVVYYVNNVTGQILTTNPYNPGYGMVDDSIKQELMSQIFIEFSTVGSSAVPTLYNSYRWSASYGQISVSAIASGLRVNYSLGDTSLRFLLPECVPQESFENDIMIPIIENIQNTILANLKNENSYPTFTFLDENGSISEYQRDYYGCVDSYKLTDYMTQLTSYARTYCTSSGSAEVSKMTNDAIILLTSSYTLRNPAMYADFDDDISKEVLESWAKTYPITAEGVAVYAVSDDIRNDEEGSLKRDPSNILKRLCPSYTFSMMYEAENACGVEVKSIDKPVFRCAIEYRFENDGTLSVSLPSSSITYDETVYVMNSITINKHFGCGDMLEDGYIFYPDGSGTIVEFSDFYSNVNSERQNVSLSGDVYGIDYAYYKITGAHRENIIMPVYGMISTTGTTAGTSAFTSKDKTKTGFFAVIEEGDALAELAFETGGASHKFASAYAKYQPFAADTFDLTESFSVSGLSAYTIFAADRYNGSYTTKIQMLTDTAVGSLAAPGEYYEASYIGMAEFYRDYLVKTGVISNLEDVQRDLPLYIEALGSMEITTKVLTFPVSTSIPLTTFEDVEKMYAEFSDAVNKITAKAEEYEALAEGETKDLILKAKYEEKAAEYRRLSEEVKNITNINFRLTGFANGGVKATYPVRTRWEDACGGEQGLKTLITASNSVTAKGANFGVYPEFDFLYINHTAMFDGMSNDGNVSSMIDNRYASKQVYNKINRAFESVFTMVIASNALDSLYDRFSEQYSSLGHDKLSVSTLGSDLNSNFDSDNVVDRQESEDYVVALLDRMANDDGYELMINSGNIYALRYASHIIDMPIDSSHFRYSSYSIPFVGLVLHGYVNYTGGALNYSGSPDYEILRSIENGASLYYILCCQNTNYMKDDKDLSKYYGVDYVNWYDSIVEQYDKLNDAIGGLQKYNIVDHKVIYAERKRTDSEVKADVERLGAEFVDFADKQIYAAVNAAFDEMITSSANNGRGVKVLVDYDALLQQAAELFDVEMSVLLDTSFDESLAALIEYYETKYSGEGSRGTPYAVNFGEVVYDSETYKTAYDYVTGSACTDENYDTTDYTCARGNVIIVTYANEKGDSVTFVLNYNIYEVDVVLEDGRTITLGKYDFERI